jgi:hypothetical protein
VLINSKYLKYLLGVICLGIYLLYPVKANDIITIMRLTVVAIIGCFFILNGMMEQWSVKKK